VSAEAQSPLLPSNGDVPHARRRAPDGSAPLSARPTAWATATWEGRAGRWPQVPGPHGLPACV